MSLDNHNSPENLEPQEPKPKIVMKYNTATIDEHGNIDGQPILQNCSATVNKSRLERYTTTEGNSGIITSEITKNGKFDINIQEFNPKTGSIKCSIDGLDFSGSVEPIYKEVRGEQKFVGFNISSKSDFIKVGCTVKSGLRKKEVTQENINDFQRRFYFDSMTFHTDDIELGVLEDDSFVNLYSIDENTSSAKNTSGNIKGIIGAILGAGIMYGAQNLDSNNIDSSSSSFREFAAETKNKVSDSLRTNEIESFHVPVVSGIGAIEILNNNNISDYDKEIVDRIKLLKGDIITVTHNGDKLLGFKNQNGKEYYKIKNL